MECLTKITAEQQEREGKGTDVARLKTRQIHACLQKSARTYAEEKGIRNVNHLMP